MHCARAAIAYLVALAALAGPAGAATRLGARGPAFTINGKPTFLLGISYYAALGAKPEAVTADLRQMKRYRINWMRVWANWDGFGNNVSAVANDGSPREPYLQRLTDLVARCDRLGMVVDVTLTRGKGADGRPRLPTLQEHRRAIKTLIAALKPHRNWYLDLSNERNVGDDRFTSMEDLRDLRELARRLDPALLVTASQGGDIGEDELKQYLLAVGVDFIAPHRPRDPGSPAQTERKTREYLVQMAALGRVVPVHYQEPFRRGYGDWQPTARDYVADLRGAVAGGAAGWCFHNGDQRGTEGGRPRRSFDLTEQPLFAQLDKEELAALDAIRQLPLLPPQPSSTPR